MPHRIPGDFTADRRLIVLSAMAVVVGLWSALVAWFLVWLIAVITNLAYFHRFSAAQVSPGAHHLGLLAVLVPVVGGLIIGLMARYGSERIRGHGIPEAIEAILIGQSRMEPKVAVLKPLSSAIVIGTGGPFGAEGPIIMTGGAFGSLFAQAFHLSPAERKTLLVAGAAAGMSAIFATPLAAVLLAVELLLFEWKPRSFIPVAIAVAVAWGLRRPLMGTGPLFPVTPHATLSEAALAGSLVLGLIVGFASVALTRLVYACEDLFRKVPLHFMWWPAIGGVAIGLGGLVEPRALGVGYDVIGQLVSGHLVGAFLIGFLIVKALIWAIALGSGTSGGVLAPLLLMGGALGALGSHYVPVGDAGLWATIGMAAIMGGTMRAPLTGVAFLVELTHDTNLLPGLLVACVAATLVTVLVLKRSILTEKVARRGHHVSREYGVNPLARLRVKDVMAAETGAIRWDLTLGALFDGVIERDPAIDRRQAWPVIDDDDRLVGLLTRGGLLRALGRPSSSEQTVRSAATERLVVTYPSELLADAVGKMTRHGIGQLPVVAPDDPGRLLGYLGPAGIAAAWQAFVDEETVREDGWLARRSRLVRRRVRRFLRPPATGRAASVDRAEEPGGGTA